MNDKPAILVGLVVLVALVTFPGWYTFGAAALFSADPSPPDLEPPEGALKFSAAFAGETPDLRLIGDLLVAHGLAPLSGAAVLTEDAAGGKFRVFDGERRYLLLSGEGRLHVYDGCIEEVEYMRSNHMTLLIEWREGVIRHGDTSTVEVNGQPYAKSLVKTCLGCHTDRQTFCYQCHEYANTLPAWPARNTESGQEGIRCWNCHLQPEEESNDG